MPSYVFPGYPTFLDSAAAELGHRDSIAHAGHVLPLTALANLCAQAAQAEIRHIPAILAKASEFRDQLAIALRAAELMLADVRDGCGVPATGTPITPAPPVVPVPHSKGRKRHHHRREVS